MVTTHYPGFIAFFPFLFFLTLYDLLIPPATVAEPVSIRDATGRWLTLPKPPGRVVSLAPSITEILFALGLEDQTIGVTVSCDYPSAAQDKEKIGGSVNPDLEVLVRLKPDLIFGIKGLHRMGLSEELLRLGLPVYLTNPDSLENILKDILIIGTIMNRSKEAEALVSRMKDRIESVRAAVRRYPRPKVLYLLWNDPMMTVTPASFIGELIEAAGGENLFPKSRKGYLRIGMEEVLVQNPDVVIFASEMGEGAATAERERWGRWEQLSAVKKQRLYVMDSDLMHRPGPRVISALESLAAVLHPEPMTARAKDRIQP